MIGYRIWIAKATGGKYGLIRLDCPDRKIEWLDALLTQGKAVHIKDGRCPGTYHIKASDILPKVYNDEILIKYVGTVGYGDAPRLNTMYDGVLRYDDTISACSPDEILCIELWDLMEIS